MPIFTYTPEWDRVRTFYSKVRRVLPANFTGLAGIRLHRTGNPLSLEILGEEAPDKPLPPMVVIPHKDGKMTRSWSDLEVDFDVPWVREADFHRYRDDVMTFYHAEDLLEPTAEQILQEETPDEELLRKATFNHIGIFERV